MPDWKSNITAPTLPDTLHYGVSARTSWPSVSVLWLGEIVSLICYFGGQNSSIGSVLGSLSRVMQGHRFDPPLRFWQRGFFPWSYHGFWPRSRLCTHAFHCTNSKDPEIHVLDGWMLATKTHPACTIHKDGMWLPKKISPKMVNPRDTAGNTEEEDLLPQSCITYKRHICTHCQSLWPVKCISVLSWKAHGTRRDRKMAWQAEQQHNVKAFGTQLVTAEKKRGAPYWSFGQCCSDKWCP